jgi:hypothetical protein
MAQTGKDGKDRPFRFVSVFIDVHRWKTSYLSLNGAGHLRIFVLTADG